MKKALPCFLWGLYVTVILYVLIIVLGINTLENFWLALTFEFISFLVLAYFSFCNIFIRPIKVGFWVPLLLTAGGYSVVVNILNIVCIAFVGRRVFTLLHLVALFAYCLVSVPMYIMDRTQI